MKHQILGILTFVILTSSASAIAATTQTATVTASVAATLSLTVTVLQLDAAGLPTGPDVGSTMNFGELVKDGTNAQWGTRAFGVFLTANTSSRLYNITGTMASPTNGINTLPNATLLKVIGATKGGADIAGDAFNPSAQAAVMSNGIIYTSSPAGDTALVNLVYGINGANPDGSSPFPGWAGIPSDFPGGEYTSSVAYSLVLL